MNIQVPEVAKKKKHTIPPNGWHNAKLSRIENDEGTLRIHWRFTAEGRRWLHKQKVDEAALGNILAEIGYAGRTVDIDDISGVEARIFMRTFGNRSSCSIEKVTATT